MLLHREGTTPPQLSRVPCIWLNFSWDLTVGDSMATDLSRSFTSFRCYLKANSLQSYTALHPLYTFKEWPELLKKYDHNCKRENYSHLFSVSTNVSKLSPKLSYIAIFISYSTETQQSRTMIIKHGCMNNTVTIAEHSLSDVFKGY